MKTIKNDTRYIIKRVIIGVLIAILLFNARKCGVYADTTDVYFYGSNQFNVSGNPRYPLYMSTQKPSTRDYYEVCSSTLDNYNIHFWYYDNGREYVNNCTIFMFKNPNNTNTYRIFATFYDTRRSGWNTLSDDYYFKIEYSSSMVQVPPNVRIIDGTTTINLATNDNFASSINYPTKTGYVEFDTSMLDGSLNPLYGVSTINYSLYNDMFNNWEFFTSANRSVYFNDIDKNPQFPPSGYSELDLTGYQGVVFVPKNYSNMNCSEVGDLCTTTFDYYYQNEIKESYFPLDGNFNLRFNSEILSSIDTPSDLKQSYFPLFQSLTENSGGNIGRLYNMYYAFLIYNYTNDGTPLDPNNYTSYGAAKVWYDSTLYNYYLVEDFNTFTETICYYINVTENGITTPTQVCIELKGLPTLREAIEQAEQENYIDPYNGNFIQATIDLLKLPFDFISNIGNGNQCEPISFPLRFPTANQDITISCLSPTYKEYLGEYYYILLSIIITGLFSYKLILYCIDSITDILDPEDNKLEAVDL